MGQTRTAVGRNGAGYGDPTTRSRWAPRTTLHGAKSLSPAPRVDPAAHRGADRRLGSGGPNALHGQAADGGTVGGQTLYYRWNSWWKC